jgi:hypothetical protein
MDEPGTHAANFVRGDGRSHAAATERHSAFNLSRGDGPGQGDDEVGVVVSGVQLVCAEVHDLVPEPRSDSATCPFKANPPWSAAIPTRIMVSP